MPNEPWNHLEIAGRRLGQRRPADSGEGKPGAIADPDQHDTSPMLAKTLFERPEGQERTTNRSRRAHHRREGPLHQRRAGVADRRVRRLLRPSWRRAQGHRSLHYSSSPAPRLPTIHHSTPLVNFIHGRFPTDERATMIAMPGVATGGGRTSIGHGAQTGRMRTQPRRSEACRSSISSSQRTTALADGQRATAPPIAGRTCMPASTASLSICLR